MGSEIGSHGWIRPLPFGGQALVIIVVHAVITGFGANSLTVSELLGPSDTDTDSLTNILEIFTNLMFGVLALIFGSSGGERAFVKLSGLPCVFDACPFPQSRQPCLHAHTDRLTMPMRLL